MLKRIATKVGDLPLWMMLGEFIAWEVWCHFFMRNKGEHTLSNRIWLLEKLHPMARIPVAGACILLLMHLLYHWL
jgi:hypothetical protein